MVSMYPGGTLANRMARAYFKIQAFAVAAWWLALALWPEWRAPFRPYSAQDMVLFAFAPGDLLLLAAGSALVGWIRGPMVRFRSAIGWAVAGATLYGAIYTLTLAITGAASPLGALLMIPAAAASTLAAFVLDDSLRSLPSSSAR